MDTAAPDCPYSEFLGFRADGPLEGFFGGLGYRVVGFRESRVFSVPDQCADSATRFACSAISAGVWSLAEGIQGLVDCSPCSKRV